MLDIFDSLSDGFMAIGQVILVSLTCMIALTFYAGTWCGLRLIGKRMDHKMSMKFFPTRIELVGLDK